MLLLLIPLTSKAQFFNFGWGDDPFFSQRQRQEEIEKSVFKHKKGNDGINPFIEDNYKNPKGSYHDTNGKIIVRCIINEKGKVAETKVMQGVGRAFDEEAVRVVKKMKFKPAKQGKKKLKSRKDIAFPIVRGKLSFSTLKTTEV
jgi:TonB family protein